MPLPENPLLVYVAQMISTEDVTENEEQIISLLNDVPASKEGALVLFPENSLFLRVSLEGFSKEDRKKQAFQLSEPVFKRLQTICSQKNLNIILGSLPWSDGTQVLNTMILVTPESIEPVYDKIHLFDVDVAGEKSLNESAQYDRGLKPATVSVFGWKLGLSICYDLRFPELYLKYNKEGVHAFLVPAAFLPTTGEAHWQVLLRARAIENQVYVLASAQGGLHISSSGKQRETHGHSMIIDPWGRVLEEVKKPKPGIISVELQPQEIKKVNEQIPMDQHRGQRLWKP